MTKTTNLSDLIAAMRARCEAATPGPWQRHQSHIYDQHRDLIAQFVGGNLVHDADFAIAARSDLPRVLDALEFAVSQLDCMGSAVPQEVFSVIEAALKGEAK